MRIIRINYGLARPNCDLLLNEDATGLDIKTEAVKRLNLSPSNPNLWQLQEKMPNGSNRVVGNLDIPFGESFHLMEIMDNA